MVLVLMLIPAGCDNSKADAPGLTLDSGVKDSGSQDGGIATNQWAPWPPVSGDAGFSIVWTINAATPNQASCEGIGLFEVELLFVHPVVPSDTWTGPLLLAECQAGEIRIEPSQGLAKGRYRFKVVRYRNDNTPFPMEPVGEITLRSGQVTLIAKIDIVQAVPAGAI